MITKTTEAAFRILVYLQTRGGTDPVTLQVLSRELGGSPTYLAKVANQLVRGGILASQRGAQGGLMLAPGTSDLPLLRVVDICQGLPQAAYCQTRIAPGVHPCSYHEIMSDLHQAVLGILGGRTIGELAGRPHGTRGRGVALDGCRMCHGDGCDRP